MAIPSHTPGTENMKLYPPPEWIPFSIARSKSRMPMWPGMRSVKLEHIPMKGLPIADFETPVAYKSDLWGALSIPFFISSLLILGLYYKHKDTNKSSSYFLFIHFLLFK
jgi:hypothetical protein